MTRRCPLRKRNRLVDVGPHKHHFCICHLRPKAPRQTAMSSLHISKISRAALTWPSSPADSMPSSDLVGKRSIYVKVLNVSLVYLQVIVSVPFINAVTHIRSPHQFAPGMSFARDRLAIAEHTRSTKGAVQIMATLEDGGQGEGGTTSILGCHEVGTKFPIHCAQGVRMRERQGLQDGHIMRDSLCCRCNRGYSHAGLRRAAIRLCGEGQPSDSKNAPVGERE